MKITIFILFILTFEGCHLGFSQESSDYKVGVVDSLYKVFKKDKKASIKERVELYSAKNEYECFQVVFYDVKKDLNNVSLKLENLGGEDNLKLNNLTIKVSEVGYVPTKKPYYKTSYVGLWPDHLMEKESFSVRKEDILILWVTVYTPQDIKSGEYKGVIKVHSDNTEKTSIPISLYVWDFSLPKESHLKTAFDFYGQFISRFYTRKKGENYEDWKARIKETIESYYLSMLDYRISPILNLDPLDADFNERISRYLERGISAFGIGKYGGSSGNNWPKDKNIIIPLYKKYANVLREKNVLDKAYLYLWDEGEIGNPNVSEIAEIIHQADSSLKNMVCYHGFWNPDNDPEWGKDLDIWCFQIANYDERLKKKLEDLGKEVWMYVSGPGGDFPNFALDFLAIDARIVPWMCFKFKVTGLLYWCVNFWTVNPYEDAMNTDWQQNGNGLLYYPGENGPVPSLRLELIRDGMEDYEYLYLLKKSYDNCILMGFLDKKKDGLIVKEIEELLELKDAAVSFSSYTKDPDTLYKLRKRIAEKIIYLNSCGGN